MRWQHQQDRLGSKTTALHQLQRELHMHHPFLRVPQPLLQLAADRAFSL